MVFKCCVTGCDGNYNEENKVSIYRIPGKKLIEERQRWLKIIPRDDIPVGPNTFVCERHWPKDFETIIRYGKTRPKHPPSIFNCVAASQVPTPPPPPRPTTKSLSSIRNTIPDELQSFLERDRLSSFEDLCQKVISASVTFSVPVTFYSIGIDLFVIQSMEFYRRVWCTKISAEDKKRFII